MTDKKTDDATRALSQPVGDSYNKEIAAASSRVDPHPDRRYRYHEILAGKYRLEKSIARGGMGLVFQATQLPLGREVAIKILAPSKADETFKKRFFLEASTCAKLQHPNIVTIHDYGQTERGDLFMVMEYLDGASLSKILAQEGRLAPVRAVSIALQVCRALRVAHRFGVVHRDLKPGNIMLVALEDELDREFVKVLDFGIAKLFVKSDEQGAELTGADVLLGSPRYMAPEQIRNQHIDPRTDIYSLGVILFFMLAGQPPFDGESPSDTLAQHLRDPIPSISALTRDLLVPADLERIVNTCLQKRPNDRYRTIDEVMADLKHAYRAMSEGSFSSDSVSDSLGTLSWTEENRLSASDLKPLPSSSQTFPLNALPMAPAVSALNITPAREPAPFPVLLLLVTVAFIGAAIIGDRLWQSARLKERAAAPLTTIGSSSRVILQTNPPGLVLIDEAEARLGTTPIQIPRPSESMPLRVRALKDGRRSVLLRVMPAWDAEEWVLEVTAWEPIAARKSDVSPTPPRESSKPKLRNRHRAKAASRNVEPPPKPREPIEEPPLAPARSNPSQNRPDRSPDVVLDRHDRGR